MSVASGIAAVGSAFLLAAAPPPVEQPRHLGPASPARVLRVVTLAPSLTEAVLALGLQDRLIGVSRFDELPEVARLPRVGGFIDPSVEAVLALKPDLVLVQPAPGNQRPYCPAYGSWTLSHSLYQAISRAAASQNASGAARHA